MFWFGCFCLCLTFIETKRRNCQALLFSVGSKSGCCSRIFCCYLPISQCRRAHRTKATELLNFNVVGARRSLSVGIERLSGYQLLTRLSLLAGWVAGLLRRERLFIGVELLLFPDVDLVLLRQWEKHNIISRCTSRPRPCTGQVH